MPDFIVIERNASVLETRAEVLKISAPVWAVRLLRVAFSS